LDRFGRSSQNKAKNYDPSIEDVALIFLDPLPRCLRGERQWPGPVRMLYLSIENFWGADKFRTNSSTSVIYTSAVRGIVNTLLWTKDWREGIFHRSNARCRNESS
jgi:hypothetical protein